MQDTKKRSHVIAQKKVDWLISLFVSYTPSRFFVSFRLNGKKKSIKTYNTLT